MTEEINPVKSYHQSIPLACSSKPAFIISFFLYFLVLGNLNLPSHWVLSPSLFSFCFIWGGALYSCPDWAWICHLPAWPPQRAAMTGHHTCWQPGLNFILTAVVMGCWARWVHLSWAPLFSSERKLFHHLPLIPWRVVKLKTRARVG